jgi:hypothetical protein
MPLMGMQSPSPWVANGNFPITYEEQTQGGYRTVADTVELNAIPLERRKEGMLVRTLTPANTIWILKSGVFVQLTELVNIEVDMSGIADGKVLAYNFGLNKFEFVSLTAGGSQYVHIQSIPATTWTINHNKNMVPAYVITDNIGNVIYGGVTIVNSNTITIDFNPASTGRVYIIT